MVFGKYFIKIYKHKIIKYVWGGKIYVENNTTFTKYFFFQINKYKNSPKSEKHTKSAHKS